MRQFKIVLIFLLLTAGLHAWGDNSCDGSLKDTLSSSNTSHSEDYSVSRDNDTNDYIYFNITEDGLVTITATKIINKVYNLSVSKTTCGGTDIYGRIKAKNHSGGTLSNISVSNGDKIYIRIDADGLYNNNERKTKLNIQWEPKPIGNQAPTVISQSISVDENSTNNPITLVGDDPDGNNNDLVYSIVAGPSHGSLSCTDCSNPTYTPTAGYHEDDSFTFKVNDGTDDSNEATVSITINAVTPPDPQIVENADDLCYEDMYSGCGISIPVIGCPCMNIGPCSGGIGCIKGYPIKNIGNSDLTNVSVDYNETGIGGSFGSNCGADSSPNSHPDKGRYDNENGGSCETTHGIDFGPIGVLGSATEYNITDLIPPNNNNNSIWAKNFVSGSCFNGTNLYGSYMKDGVLHRGKLKPCSATGIDYPCGKPHAFEERKSFILNGDLIAIGNSSICADNDRDGKCDDDQERRNDIAQGGNNLIFINSSSITNDSNYNEPTELFNATSAELKIPEGATIKWAGLYWQGEIWDFKTSNTSSTSVNTWPVDNGSSVAIENGAAGQARKALADKIKFKLPGGSYQDLTADEHYYVFLKRTTNNNDTKSHYPDYAGIPRYEEHYQSFKDVTTLLQTLTGSDGANGNYSVANIQATVGALHFPGVEAAWNLQVIYEYPGAKAKSVTITDGYVALYGSASQGANYAKDNGCGETYLETGVYAYSIDFDVTGFLTPKTSGFETDMSIFVTESDPEASSTEEWLKITKKDGTQYLVDGNNAWNYEITNKDGTNNLDRTPAYIYPIGMTIKNYRITDALSTDQTSTNVTFQTDSDRLILGVIGFSTELRAPNICYDFTYGQSGSYIRAEDYDPPRIHDEFNDEPIDVKLYFENNESSDITIENLDVRIDPIAGGVTYEDNSTYITKPNENLTHLPDDGRETGSGYDRNITIGDLGASENFYVYYSLDHPNGNTINTPINATLTFDFKVNLNGADIDLGETSLNIANMNPCPTSGVYSPPKGIFNVAHDSEIDTGLSSGHYYNLPTQAVGRVGNYKVVSMNPDNLDETNETTAIVAVEMLDAEGFHYTSATCLDEKATIVSNKRVWVIFDPSHPKFVTLHKDDIVTTKGTRIGMTNADFFDTALQNGAFRISYNVMNDGDPLDLTQLTNGKYKITDFPSYAGDKCHPGFEPPNGSSQSVAHWCGSNGTGNGAGMDPAQLAVCMECIYGYNTKRLCSRDNFAIRPESFRMVLNDKDSGSNKIKIVDNVNLTTKNIVSGYDYLLDINASNYINDNASTGYRAVFSSDNTDPNRVISFQWDSTKDETVCNDISDKNISLSFSNGQITDFNVSNPQIGEYKLHITDKLWTQVDWDSNMMQHHTGDFFHSSTTPDCDDSGHSVTAQADDTPLIGCTTTSNDHSAVGHTSSPSTYEDILLHFYPHRFNVSGLTLGARPSNDGGNTFVYNHTMNKDLYRNSLDRNMSYNVQGTFTAVDFTNNAVTNFVTGCYAESVNMDLDYTYNSMTPADTLTLGYDLFDYNISGYTRTTTALPSGNLIPQVAANFVKDMNGSINMDLGYNEPRTYNAPKNPIYVEIKDFNISQQTQPSPLYVDGISNHQIFGNVDVDKNVTFVYGRAKPNTFFYDDVTAGSILTPVSIVAYCDLGLVECQNRGLSVLATGMLTDAQSNESSWWYSQNHNTALGNDGQVTLTASGGGTVVPVDATSINLTNGIDNTVLVTNTGGTPNIVDIDFGSNTDRWLIYNEDNNSVPSPFYRVRFIGTGSWTGKGKTGHVVGDDINRKKTRRLGW